MPLVSRRTALAGLSAAALLPRPTRAQADSRPVITIAVQRIATSNTLDIVNEASNVGTRHYNLYSENLIDTDWTGDLSLRPGLAESWQRIDGRSIEFTLRRGVRFHNGDELTADDVAFTFGEKLFGTAAEAEMAPGATRDPRWATTKVRSLARSAYPAFDKIEVLDRYRLRFVNRIPDVTLEGRISMRYGAIVSARAYREAPSYLDWARKPIGTGPYRVAEYKPEQHLILEAFDDYWGGRPPIKTLRFIEVPELASRINGLASRDFDLACDITPDQIPTIQSDSRLDVRGGLITNIRVLMFDTNFPALKDTRVRRAFTHAIDRQAIVDTLWAGLSRVPRGLQFPFYGPIYLEDWAAPAYDPALARSLLKEAGYQGEPIPYKLLNNYYTNQVATAQVLAEMFKAVGLNVPIEMRENWSQIEAKSVVRSINDNSASAFFNDPVSFMPGNFGEKGDFRLNGYWANTDVLKPIEVLNSSTDLTERRAALRRTLEIVEREDPALTVLNETANFTAVRKAIQWQPAKSFVMDFRSRNFQL